MSASWRRILAALAAALLALSGWLVLEGAAWLFRYRKGGWTGLSGDTRYEFDEYLTYRTAPGFSKRGVKHNDLGFRRSTDVSLEKPQGTLRIFLLGGSAAYGVGSLFGDIRLRPPDLPNDQTIDTHLEEELKKGFPGVRFEVINAAVPGYWTHHHLLNFIVRLRAMAPDMIICMDGFNDYFNYVPGFQQYYSNPFRHDWSDPVVHPGPLGMLAIFLRWAGEHSFLMRELGKSYLERRVLRGRAGGGLASRTPPSRFPVATPEERRAFRRSFTETASASFLLVYRQLLALCKLQQTDLVIAFQPMLVLRDKESLTEAERKLWDYAWRPKERWDVVWDEEMLTRYRIMYDASGRMLAALEGEGAYYIDLHEKVKGCGGQVFTDPCHLTAEGGRCIARILAGRIKPALLKRIPRPQ